jgi:hypothetical protein
MEQSRHVVTGGEEGEEGEGWEAAFGGLHARFAPFVYRQDVRERSGRDRRGLLGPVERKNGGHLAEAGGEADSQGLQRLLYAARWEAEVVRDEVSRFVSEQWGDSDGNFAVDETGLLKQGSTSVGVQRQYTGTAGKIEHCQVGVFLPYGSPPGQALLDRRLSRPHGWAEEATRRRRQRYRKRGRARPSRHGRGRCWSTPGRWALGAGAVGGVGDTVDGQDPTVRAPLEARAPAVHDVLAVPRPPLSGRRRPGRPSRPARRQPGRCRSRSAGAARA